MAPLDTLTHQTTHSHTAEVAMLVMLVVMAVAALAAGYWFTTLDIQRRPDGEE
jgi:hypothetical protein